MVVNCTDVLLLEETDFDEDENNSFKEINDDDGDDNVRDGLISSFACDTV